MTVIMLLFHASFSRANHKAAVGHGAVIGFQFLFADEVDSRIVIREIIWHRYDGGFNGGQVCTVLRYDKAFP
mgnify:CR=1 FL=1